MNTPTQLIEAYLEAALDIAVHVFIYAAGLFALWVIVREIRKVL